MEFRIKLDTVSAGIAAGLLAGTVLGGVIAIQSGLTPAHRSPWAKLFKAATCKSASSSTAVVASSKPTAAAATSSSGNDEGKGEEERAAERPAFWFEENLTEVYSVKMVLNKIMFEDRSQFQLVQVVETEQFGKTLVLDGQTQSAEADEKVYHETLVHPAMLLHPEPKSVFIGGGGEFATAREVLRHNSVTRCVMVDIDKVACDICREQLPEWNDGAYEDPRFHVEYEDARQWLEEHDEKFDVIIMDICDPIEAGPGYRLYTEEFYKFLKTRLTEGGVVVTQSGPGAIYNAKEECFTVINSTLRSAFNCVVPFAVDVPSFGCNWGFNLATNAGDGSPEAGAALKHKILNPDIDETNAALSARIANDMYFLDGVSLRGLFGIPKTIREACEAEDRVMTIDNPVFMYSG